MNFLKIYFQIIIIFLISISFAHTVEKTAFLDIDYVLNESNYGKSITKELEKLNKKNLDLLNSKEKNYLFHYHLKVYSQISEYLNFKEKKWLASFI